MTTFAAIVAINKVDPQSEALLLRVKNGVAHEQTKALNSLVDRAQQSQDPDDWNTAGIAFHYAGENDKAVNVFVALVESMPEGDVYRLNLATAYSQTEQMALCRHHLQYLAQYGKTEEMRRTGAEQLEGYEHFIGVTPQQQKLQELQIKALRAVVQGRTRTADDFEKLARLLTRIGRVTADEDLLHEATEVLEQGRTLFPKSTSILEVLVGSYLHHDPHERLSGALTELERLNPRSQVLEIVGRLRDQEAQEFRSNLLQRGWALTQDASQRDERTREAALEDLARIVITYPDNQNYRFQYAFALIGAGKKSDAREQAQQLAKVPEEAHEFYFNIGQIFWLSGDANQGRHYLNLAFQYARNDLERDDVRERIADLEGE